MAADIMKLVESRETRTDLPNFAPGDTIKVHVKVKEGDKERIQIFQGLVISRRGGGNAPDVHGAQGFRRNRCGTHIPALLTFD